MRVMRSPAYYDLTYYERGTLTGRSCYDTYHWQPETTIPLAMGLVDLTGLPPAAPVLDFGCARGYLVKALRWLRRDAYGCDHSSAALKTADPEVRTYLRLSTADRPVPFTMRFHLAVAKDVLEHCDEPTLRAVLAGLRAVTETLVVIVPLGDGDRYTIPYMEEEPDHVLAQPLRWWQGQLEAAGFQPDVVRHTWPGIKPQWGAYTEGHGILYAR